MKTAANIPVRGWRDRIFSVAAFFFVSVFIVFIVGLILTDVFYINRKAVVTLEEIVEYPEFVSSE